MAKIDKSQYTKQEFQRIKAQRRYEKELNRRSKPVDPVIERVESTNNQDKKYIVCLKHGTKYSADYVNVLHSMVTRNCTHDFEFVCFTEDSKGINTNIRIEPLPELPVQGWWYKPMFFNPALQLQGTILFFDLDVIIFNNIDYLFDYQPGRFCIIKDFNRAMRPEWNKFNSSVFRLTIGDQAQVYNEFLHNTHQHVRRFHGDQDWIHHMVRNNFDFWPIQWIQSYKWEMRKRARIVRDSNGKRNFAEAGKPHILPDTSVAVFHGEPNPKECIDQWCKDNWY